MTADLVVGEGETSLAREAVVSGGAKQAPFHERFAAEALLIDCLQIAIGTDTAALFILNPMLAIIAPIANSL